MEKLTGKEILKLITQQQALVAEYERSVNASKSSRLNTLAFAQEQLELAQEGLRKMEDQVFAFVDDESKCCAPSISMSGSPGEPMEINRGISDSEMLYRLCEILRIEHASQSVRVEANAQLIALLRKMRVESNVTGCLAHE